MRIISQTATLSLLAVSSTFAAEANSGDFQELTYGVEALAQYRNEYNYRGFEIADDTIDLQLSTQFALDNDFSINTAAWYGTETGSGDFSEIGLFADIRKDIGQATYALSGTYRDYDNTLFFESGFDIAATAIWHFDDCWDFSTTASYDTGADAWYGGTKASYYYRINDSSYFNFNAGISYVDNYYGRDGFNDVFGKVSYTYNINSQVSVSPYLATSILVDNDDLGSDSLYGGVYFAVAF